MKSTVQSTHQEQSTAAPADRLAGAPVMSPKTTEDEKRSQRAERRAVWRIRLGWGFLALSFGVAAMAALGGAWVQLVAVLWGTALGLALIFTGYIRRLDIANQRHHVARMALIAHLRQLGGRPR